jgi:hypothetical protein
VCGVVAGLIGGTAEVTLRRPPPLGRPLDVVREDDGRVILRDDETIVAEGSPGTVDIDVPDPVSFAEATEAAKSYWGYESHPFATCFGCGPERAEGDGLRIFAGPVEGRDGVAAPWVPDASLADEDGTVREEFMWAALDCSGGFPLWPHGSDGSVVVLGRISARMMGSVAPGERCVVIGWRLGREGRKLYSGTAVLSGGSELRALAKETWLSLPEPPSSLRGR